MSLSIGESGLLWLWVPDDKEEAPEEEEEDDGALAVAAWKKLFSFLIGTWMGGGTTVRKGLA